MRLFLRFALAALLPALLSACASAPREMPRPRPVSGPPIAPRPAPVPAAQSVTPPQELIAAVQAQVRQFDGKVGVAIARNDASWTIANHGSDLFPQQSVSKLWVAMTVLDAVDRGKLSLSDEVVVRDADRTVFNQPITQYITGDGYRSSIDDLLRFSMVVSDNTANDVLLRKAGGPEAVRAFLQRKGLTNIRFGPGEKDLQALTAGLVWQAGYAKNNGFREARAKLTLEQRQAAFDRYLSDPVDGASPVGMARALLRLKKGDLLSPASTRLLLQRMGESKTGPERLKGGVPYGWQFVHKTGTGQDLNGVTAGYNDVAVMTAPDGTHYAVVVLIAPARSAVPQRKALMQAISLAVASAHRPIVGRAASR